MNDFKVIIAGSRNFCRYKLLQEKCDLVLANKAPCVTILCGMARGADLLGKRYAEEKGYGVLPYPAEWDKHGRSAGYLRNKKMAENADALIAFWDGQSRGTEHMINLACKRNLEVRVFRYEI